MATDRSVTNGETLKSGFTPNGTVKIYVIIASVLGLISGGAGSWGYNQIYDPRPFPFTSSDAEDLEERWDEKYVELQAEISVLVGQVAAMQLQLAALPARMPPKEWRDRIRALEFEAARRNPGFPDSP